MTAAPLFGLVLAGGRGSRLGRDKGLLDYHGMPQVQWLLGLLSSFCAERFVSVRGDQASSGVYKDFPSIVDLAVEGGPASGLLAAFDRYPAVAWLVIAVDMPMLEGATLARLVAGRDAGVLATAYRRVGGPPEPLCAIWEPAVRPLLEGAAGGGGGVSLRRLLETGPAALLTLSDETPLRSVNTLEDDASVRRLLAAR